MSFVRDIEALAAQEPELARLARERIAHIPSPATIASFIRLERALLGWKKDALAFVAGVSLSTIERIERGDSVSPESLGRVAAALRQPPGAFTAPRIPLSTEEAMNMVVKSFLPYADRIPVAVRPLRGHRQIADLTRTDFLLLDASRLEGDHAVNIAALREWLDLTSFILATDAEDSIIQRDRLEPVRRRQLYEAVLDQVRTLERSAHAVVLAGTYEATSGTTSPPSVRIALIALFSTRTDPGAAKRRTLMAPATIDVAEAWATYSSVET
jgi:transcriptional regulator with XRE-family HTH domain